MGELQFVLGPSGSGKSYYIYEQIIKQSIENPHTRYIMLVPEQFSMVLQKKIVTMHPNKGTFNIDVIGFNRLAYRVFEEQHIKTDAVLEDFGKSMLIRHVAGAHKNELSVYGDSLDKNGFIDEVKSLMSELYQYDVKRDELDSCIDKLKEEKRKSSLVRKLGDLKVIFESFDEYLEEHKSIVAEQLTTLLANSIKESRLVKNSVIVMDGFTGFTPIQLKVIGELFCHAKKVYSVITIDKKSYEKPSVGDFELFYLSRQTIDGLKEIANKYKINIQPDMTSWSKDFGEKNDRWSSTCNEELRVLEKGLFRYPYEVYDKETQNITLSCYSSSREEIHGIARAIRSLIVRDGYRYKDIAVICGELEKASMDIREIFDEYDISYFMDYNQPVKNNAYIDAITMALMVAEKNFAYEMVFSFLKSGVISDKELSYAEICRLEQYVLRYGKKGLKQWEQSWGADIEPLRELVYGVLGDFVKGITGGKKKVTEYVDALYALMEKLRYNEMPDEKIYAGLLDILEKLRDIIGEESLDIHEFREVLELGLKELTIGMVPPNLDMVVVGDITRTRIDKVRVLFIIDVNEGVIPKDSARPQIISDSDKDELRRLGMQLAPSDKQNYFTEQFYIYQNMTKPSDKLLLSYVDMSADNKKRNASFVIARVKNIFPKLKTYRNKSVERPLLTKKSGRERLVGELRRAASGELNGEDKILSLIKLYKELGDVSFYEKSIEAVAYSNVTDRLKKEVAALIKDCLLAKQSVSKLEQYAKCQYAYFLKYVLGLSDDKVLSINKIDYGSILHGALYDIYTELNNEYKNGEFTWGDLSVPHLNERISHAVSESFEKSYRDIYIEDYKYAYLKDVLTRVAKKSVHQLFKSCDRADSSDEFTPLYFEKNIHVCLDALEDMPVELDCKIDRVDRRIRKEQKDGKEITNNAYRIIDYKTSSCASYDINRVYDGLDLQIAIYLNAIVQFEQRGAAADDLHVRDSAYYFRLHDPWTAGETVEKANAKKEKEYELVGIDESFDEAKEILLDYSSLKAKKLIREMVDGNIQKNPTPMAQGVSCDYCEYKAVCRFDTKYGGNKLKKLTFGNTRDEKLRAIESMKEELDGLDN